MLRARVRELRRGASFSVRFALILAGLGVVMALATAAIPVQVEDGQARNVALDRAADKGGIAVNLLSAQRSSLQTYVDGIAGQLAPPLAGGDTLAATVILQRQSAVSDSHDVIGVPGTAILRDGTPVAAGDPEIADVQAAVGQHRGLAMSSDGTPWLVQQSAVSGVSGAVVFIARPMLSGFLDRLAADLGGGADAAALAVIRHGAFVAGSTAPGGPVHPGAAVPTAYTPAARNLGGAVLVSVDDIDTAASMRPMGSGVSLLVTTRVAPVAGFVSTLVGPVAAIAVALILLAMVLVYVIVQRDLQRPLRRLDRAVAALEREDFDVPIPPGNDDELGRLGRSFDRMRRTLRATLYGAEARAAIASELNAAQPLQTSLQRVCTALLRTTSARAALIAVDHSDMADAFVTAQGLTGPVDPERLLRGGGPCTSALALDTAAPLQAVALDGSEEARVGMCDVCAAPLRIGSRVLGALAVADKAEPFNAADVALVSAAAEQVSLALERYRILADAQHQASTDELTGLYNYRFLVDYLDQQIALAERLDSPLAVLMLDLDRFKVLNDTHGHHAGDEALRRFAAALRDTVRRSDLAARYGGEEFVVVMANTNREEARLVAEKIRRAVAAQPLSFHGETVQVTVSIGGVAYPDDTGDARQLLHLADAALYRAKRGGRDRVCFVSDGARRRTLARMGAADTANTDTEGQDEQHLTGHRPAQ